MLCIPLIIILLPFFGSFDLWCIKHQVQSVARSIDRVLYEVVDIPLVFLFLFVVFYCRSWTIFCANMIIICWMKPFTLGKWYRFSLGMLFEQFWWTPATITLTSNKLGLLLSFIALLLESESKISIGKSTCFQIQIVYSYYLPRFQMNPNQSVGKHDSW